jgi:aminomethyltransferase
MPVMYTSITDEHLAVRSVAGLFDLGHMGRIRITGEGRLGFVERVTTMPISRAEEGRVQYGFILNQAGGVIDDITGYRAADHVFLVVNGANRLAVVDWFGRQIDGFQAAFEDVSDKVGMIAIQGPRARHMLQHETTCHLDSIGYYRFATCTVAGVRTLVSRTGYTGEDGFELYMDAAACQKVWDALLRAGEPEGLRPIGLGARDTLRLEASLPLYGNELDLLTTPIEAGLKKFVDLEGHDFIGRAALVESLERGPSKSLVCLVTQERVVPRHGYKIFGGGAEIGGVTSGTFSPTLNQGIAMAYIAPGSEKVDTRVEIEIRGQRHPARVVPRPFYKRRRA